MKKIIAQLKGLGLLSISLILLLGACGRPGQAGELRTDSETVSLGNAERVVTEITMGAGELTVQGGAEGLMEAEFTYNVEVWQPEVDYSVNDNVGRLFISQPAEVEFDSNLTNFRYRWDVRLNEEVPLELRVELGAGNSELDIGALDLTALDISAGAGNITVDLTGERQRDLTAAIRGGVGSLTVLLPGDVGVKVDVSGGLGQVVATGLSRNEEGSFVNTAFNTAENTIILAIQGGVGEVNLEVVE